LWITDGTERVIVENFTNGALGISLDNMPRVPDYESAVQWVIAPEIAMYADALLEWPGHVIGSTSADSITLHWFDEGPRIADGRESSDEIFADDGIDFLYAHSASDLAAIIDGSAPTVAGSDRDVLFGAGGDDLIVGSAGADWLAGGTGEDTIYGGAGDDIITGLGAAWAVRSEADYSAALGPWQGKLVFSPYYDTGLPTVAETMRP
jgi:hypothetical protein